MLSKQFNWGTLMSISSFATHKILALNEGKNKGITVEFSPDMPAIELLDRINDIRNALLAGMEADKKKEEAPSQENQAPN